MTAMDDFVTDAQQRMDKSVEATHDHFNTVRTGRASAALLDRITIDYYGTPSPLKNIASISVPESALASYQTQAQQIVTALPDCMAMVVFAPTGAQHRRRHSVTHGTSSHWSYSGQSRTRPRLCQT